MSYKFQSGQNDFKLDRLQKEIQDNFVSVDREGNIHLKGNVYCDSVFLNKNSLHVGSKKLETPEGYDNDRILYYNHTTKKMEWRTMSEVLIAATDSPSIDAFGRWRVSNPTTIFDSKQLHDSQPLLWDDAETSGTGTSSSHSTAEAATTISVTDLIAGTRVRQTFMKFNYQPGKSQLLFLTFSEFDTASGITKRVGYFDSNDGIFLESEEGTINVVRRTYVSGSAVDNEIPQAEWNIDKMNGAGPSGVSLDFTKTQIFIIDIEWLGVGRVRCGFVVDGKIYYCHQFLNTNNLTTVYMSNPNLPVRYEISNDGTGAADDFVHICATVISEGGTNDLGVLRYASTAGTHVDLTTENTVYAVMGIRLKSTHVNASVKLINAALQIHTASDKVEWSLVLNPTVAGTFTYSNQTNSAVQIATGASANTVTGGTNITGGFLESGGAQAGSAGSDSKGIENAILLGSDISGNVDEIVLCARPIAGSSAVDIEGSLTWREL